MSFFQLLEHACQLLVVMSPQDRCREQITSCSHDFQCDKHLEYMELYRKHGQISVMMRLLVHVLLMWRYVVVFASFVVAISEEDQRVIFQSVSSSIHAQKMNDSPLIRAKLVHSGAMHCEGCS